MFKHQMEIVQNHGNGYRDWLFYLSMAKDSHLSDYLEVYSLSSDQVFLWVQFQMFFKVQWIDF